MPVNVNCPRCGHSGTVPDSTTRVNCSKCGSQFQTGLASLPPPLRRRRKATADLYELEREFLSIERELRDAQAQLVKARDELRSHPTSAQDIERFRQSRLKTDGLRQDYEIEQKKLSDIDSEIFRLEGKAGLLRRRLSRGRFFYSGVGQALICAAEVLALFFISVFFLSKMPVAIWAILFFVLALGTIALSLMAFSIKRQSHLIQVDRLLDELASVETSAWSVQPARAAAQDLVDSARDTWEKADAELRRLKDRIRPWIRHERALEEHEEIRLNYDMVRVEYEGAQTERRLRLARRNWRYFKADEFEAFVREVFEALGYQTSSIGKAGDQGVDVIASRDGVRWAIQCKGYAGNLGNKPIQEVFAGARIHNCHRWLVITTSGFTSGGREAAKGTQCVLIEGCDIPELIMGRLKL